MKTMAKINAKSVNSVCLENSLRNLLIPFWGNTWLAIDLECNSRQSLPSEFLFFSVGIFRGDFMPNSRRNYWLYFWTTLRISNEVPQDLFKQLERRFLEKPWIKDFLSVNPKYFVMELLKHSNKIWKKNFEQTIFKNPLTKLIITNVYFNKTVKHFFE